MDGFQIYIAGPAIPIQGHDQVCPAPLKKAACSLAIVVETRRPYGRCLAFGKLRVPVARFGLIEPLGRFPVGRAGHTWRLIAQGRNCGLPPEHAAAQQDLLRSGFMLAAERLAAADGRENERAVVHASAPLAARSRPPLLGVHARDGVDVVVKAHLPLGPFLPGWPCRARDEKVARSARLNFGRFCETPRRACGRFHNAQLFTPA